MDSLTNYDVLTFGSSDDVIVLDVDRCIINTTAWYHACLTPFLLIPEELIPRFSAANAKAFRQSFPGSKADFRSEVLSLIEERLSSNFVNLVRHVVAPGLPIQEGTLTNDYRLYLAGKYSAETLCLYPAVGDYLRFAQRFYGHRLRVLFLSSGYEGFIHGLVENLLQRARILKLRYEVIGSKLRFQNGRAHELWHNCQRAKQMVVEDILRQGARIRLLADDSRDNLELFAVVERAGGDALLVKHEGRADNSESWAAYVTELRTSKLEAELKYGPHTSSLSCTAPLSEDVPRFLSARADQVGIVRLSLSEYRDALRYIESRAAGASNGTEVTDLISRHVKHVHDCVLLRGDLYYYWIPSSVTGDFRGPGEKWESLFLAADRLLFLTLEASALHCSEERPLAVDALIFSAFDHYCNALVAFLAAFEAAELKGKLRDHLSQLGVRLEEAIERVYRALYRLFARRQWMSLLREAMQLVPRSDLLRLCKEVFECDKGVRELDDAFVIFASARSLSVRLALEHVQPAYIVTFQYGAIELGFALRAILIEEHKSSFLPVLLHCHYSSKLEARSKKAINYADASWLEQLVPVRHLAKFQAMLAENTSILLYDNNVTTYSTLKRVSAFLASKGCSVTCAVAAVNYKNMKKFFLGEEAAEPVCSDWREILSFNPVCEYVEAFSTWGSGTKSRVLESLYGARQLSITTLEPTVASGPKQFHFKICRVHNVIDLGIALGHGADFIGIHAVYPCQYRHIGRESRFAPCLWPGVDFDPSLCISFFEVESIRAMQRFMPSGMVQVVVFERPLHASSRQKVIDVYGMSGRVTLQLQHRFTADYLRELRQQCASPVIAAIGIAQDDFREYFAFLNRTLDPKRDTLLLDLSSHQPQWIEAGASPVPFDKYRMLRARIELLRGSATKIFVADDVSVSDMKGYVTDLLGAGVPVAGIDIQNAIERPVAEQGYRTIDDGLAVYQARLRKTAESAVAWRQYVQSLRAGTTG